MEYSWRNTYLHWALIDFFIRLPPEFLPASGPTERWCASTFGAAMLISSGAGYDFGLVSRLVWGLFFPHCGVTQADDHVRDHLWGLIKFNFNKLGMWWGLCQSRNVMGLGNIIGLSRLNLFTITQTIKYCYKLIQLFKVTCFIVGHYYGTFTDVI